MKDLGFSNVRVEKVKVPHWVRGAESGEILSPWPQPDFIPVPPPNVASSLRARLTRQASAGNPPTLPAAEFRQAQSANADSTAATEGVSRST
jgi:hypothetical protein